MIGVLPVWLTGIGCFLAMTQMSSFGVLQVLHCLFHNFASSGLIEAFAAITMMGLLTTHWPERMKTFGGAIFFLSLSIASYLSSIIINIILNYYKNRLDYFYFTIAALASLNLICFCVFARHYLRFGEPQKSSHNCEANDEETELRAKESD